MIKGKEGVELSSVEMHVKKKPGGYIVLAALNSKGKTLHAETEITDYASNTRIINLAVSTDYTLELGITLVSTFRKQAKE